MRPACGLLLPVVLVGLYSEAYAQPVAEPAPPAAAAAEPAAAPQEIDPIELMRQMGAGDEEIMMMQLLGRLGGLDPNLMMLLMMMADGGNGGDDMIGMLLLSKALAGGGPQPAACVADGKLLVVEDGAAYKIDIETWKLEGSVGYRQRQKVGLPTEMMGVFQQAREKALLTSCLSNMKQVCLAAMMYAQDWDETLPAENWPQDLEPYTKNTALYRCPADPERPVAYALNEALAGAKLGDIKRPAEVVLFFEASTPPDIAFGGVDAVPAEAPHAGQVVVGFVDGHARAMSVEELRQLLQQNPFE